MAWKPMDSINAEKLATAASAFAFDKRKMFGYDVYFVNGNMAAGMHGSDLFMRFSSDDRNVVPSEVDAAQPFEPRPGLVMREYLTLPSTVLDDTRRLMELLSRSFTYVSSLPPKRRKG